MLVSGRILLCLMVGFVVSQDDMLQSEELLKHDTRKQEVVHTVYEASGEGDSTDNESTTSVIITTLKGETSTSSKTCNGSACHEQQIVQDNSAAISAVLGSNRVACTIFLPAFLLCYYFNSNFIIL